MKKGKVWLVGAGPGDIGLFTLKGMEVLQSWYMTAWWGRGSLQKCRPRLV